MGLGCAIRHLETEGHIRFFFLYSIFKREEPKGVK
jgi:hypothetical protein